MKNNDSAIGNTLAFRMLLLAIVLDDDVAYEVWSMARWN